MDRRLAMLARGREKELESTLGRGDIGPAGTSLRSHSGPGSSCASSTSSSGCDPLRDAAPPDCEPTEALPSERRREDPNE